MKKKDKIKWENILTPQEMAKRFSYIDDWIKGGRNIYINSNYFMSELLRHVHEDTKDFDRVYSIADRNIPYVYKRIVEEAEKTKRTKRHEEPPMWETVSNRRLRLPCNL